MDRVPPRARLRVFPARVPSGRREGRALRMRVPVGRVGPMVRLRDGVSVRGVRGVGGLDVDVIVVAEGGEDVAPGLVRPCAGGRP